MALVASDLLGVILGLFSLTFICFATLALAALDERYPKVRAFMERLIPLPDYDDKDEP